MRLVGGGRDAARAVVGLASGALLTLAVAMVSAPTGPAQFGVGPSGAVPAISHVVVEQAVAPLPSAVVRETGSWFAHGYTLDLRPDGTGTFAVWNGAYDGTRLQLRLVPLPGPAVVADITAIETVGAGALGPRELPGLGGLVTVAVGEDVRTAHVEWTSGPQRLAADLCPTEGLDAAAMAALRCGA